MNKNDLTSKEKYNIANSLVGLVQSLTGKSILVELQNNCQVAGVLETCDGYMNLTLHTVVVIDGLGKQYGFDNFMVTKRNVRYVHIPKNVIYRINQLKYAAHQIENSRIASFFQIKIIPQIEAELTKLRQKRLKPKSEKLTFKQKRSEMNQLQTIRDLQNR